MKKSTFFGAIILLLVIVIFAKNIQEIANFSPRFTKKTLPRTEKYIYMERKFNLTEEQKKELIKNSIDAAFTSENVKKWLRKEFSIKES